MTKYQHPMSVKRNPVIYADQSMGIELPFLKNLEDKGREYIDSAKDQLVAWGVDPKDIQAVERQAQEALEQEKRQAAQDLLAQVTGAKDGFAPKSGSIIPIGIQERVASINANPIMAAIPGGFYTVAGLSAAAILYFTLRK